ncbi:YceI family protein [Cyclobacterium sp.]|uniref:YceI family protein n=1 Tax=Cyclobacterium sp. TaxID=1966343 RepID=UPI001993C838|nr:YceI family protein [Cyclobacterium sp.]MBD3627727.1 YceI family protein [Cyclobacterium sp.]
MKCTFLLALFIVACVGTVAQHSFTLSTNQELKVKGTSTIHDWKMVSGKAKGNAEIELKGNKITGINSMVINLPAFSLKSGKGGMDNNAYEALLAKQYPQIFFELTEVETITDQMIKAEGRITIAGTTRVIPLQVNYKVSERTILFSGGFPITFTQYKIDPPKALLGTIKTGDELQISFETTFKLIN